ncbi:MAG: tyrosine-type recombinase/integrase [Candidatus Helarchaeota archaeon]
MEPTKRYPDNDELRLILELANNQQKLAVLLGYQCGLLPSDIVSLTWERLNLNWDDERDFIHVENMREKTGAKHVFVLNPDLFHYLRAHWVDSEKPDSGWVFTGYKDSGMTSRNLNQFFKDLAVKALGETRGSEIVFKDLRDCYNEAILDSGVNEEVKDTYMGHLRESAKSSYSISTATVLREYREKIFPKIAVNGWRLRQKASEADELREALDELKMALSQIEEENTGYRTRLDNQKDEIKELRVEGKELTENYSRINDAFTSLATSFQLIRDYRDILDMWINAYADDEFKERDKEMIEAMKKHNEGRNPLEV